MKKTLKIIGIVVGVIILLLLIVPLFVNADSFRPLIQSKAQEALGRNVQIGKLGLSLFSGSLSADGITIADDPKFSNQPFVTAKSLDVSVDVMPLIFSRELHVNSIKLVQPQVALISNAQGQWNYSSLGGAAASGKAPEKPAPQKPAPGTAQKPSEAPANYSVDEIEITNGKITMSEVPSKQPPTVYNDVDLTLKRFAPGSQMPFTLSLKAPRGGTIKADGTAGPLNPNDASLTPLQVNLKNSAVEIAGLAPTSGISGLLDMNAKFTSDGRSADLTGNGAINHFKAVANGTAAKDPLGFNYNTKYSYASREGNLNATVTARKNTARLSGGYQMREAMLVHMNLNGQGLSVDELESLLPAFGVVLPSGSSLQGGTLSANLNLQGPLDQLTIAGPVSLNNTKLAGFNLSQKMSGLSQLAGIKTGNDATIQTFSSNVNVTPAVTRADNINLIMPALGHVTGAGTIANQNLNFKMVATVQATGGGLLGAAGGKAGSQNVPFAIQGTTSNPRFIPDTSALVQNAVQQQINQRLGGQAANPNNLGGALGGLFGGSKKKH
ncbi:MAG TPA: AsmA family protein [Terriglobales bacterium]|jgi:AsmA protein|nr:AsmA family protein [Terriglobales bacterium]